MSPSDISEKGLETLIVRHLTGATGLEPVADGVVAEAAMPEGNGWLAGNPRDYDRAYALDAPQLFQFFLATQPDAFSKLGLTDYKNPNDITRQKFLARISAEIGKRGVIDLLRKGVDHGPVRFELFYGTPSPGNARPMAA